MIDWFLDHTWALWLGVFLVLVVVEMFSLEFFCLMMAGGAVAAAAASGLTDSIAVQVLVFAIVSVLLVLAVRPVMMRRLHRDTPETRNNVEALIGRSATVLEPVDGAAGLVRLAGDAWTARTEDCSRLPDGAPAVVLRIDGATAVVAAVPASP